MNVRALMFAVLAIGAMMSPAFGQQGLRGGQRDLNPYVGASIGTLRYDESGLDTITPSVIFARIGFPLDRFFAIEARLGTGLSSDNTGGASVSAGTFGGAYLKGSIALAPTFSVYGVAGVASTSLHRNFGAGDTTDTGFSGGLGGDIRLTRELWINFEWTRLPSGTNAGFSYDTNLLSAGVNFHF
jgi:hypothetical protein